MNWMNLWSAEQALNLLLALKLGLLKVCKLLSLGDEEDVSLKALVETLAPENGLKGLLPGHIVKAEGDVSGYRVGGNKVKFIEVSGSAVRSGWKSPGSWGDRLSDMLVGALPYLLNNLYSTLMTTWRPFCWQVYL